ncbi:adaptor protein MecA [Pseudobacillus badius]|uniref:adaptor protein MecA n=1 Tax=Bacillus badius TaxID=1455 RepID=UPI0007B0AF65|nr:adaptor protein MecA [Bacillus badius]KZO01221.1 adaptor protein MecA [Bacillus badius]MED0667909.1 adaptor protein MecA [Bacillus badius]OCS89399.1 adaptor protein MecA [Bacillus badius]OVE51222.1 adaptor protein MecA [Bacillus badius]TDW02210.1 adapter protein MecA 1/2 [Bacillus badius]
MEIERINDNTVKFYISYLDIEERGFDREEIWYNRERSEELFWDMMEEIHDEEDFTVDGPLWIQVQALDKGLEILVTQANLTKDGQRIELPLPGDKYRDFPVDDRLEELLDEHFQANEDDDEPKEPMLEFMLSFNDFEDLIQLSKRAFLDELATQLYAYNGKYYLFVEFPEETMDEEKVENTLSLLLEYTDESGVTIHRLQEYGKCVMESHVFETVRKYFN